MYKCYMCDKEGITKEHVPPKCIFPESKDISSGDRYRINLITVKSCEYHNTAKSKDDMYLLFILAAHISSNDLAQEHFAKKIRRAISRQRHVFVEFVKKNTRAQISESGELINTFAIEIDRERFDSAIRHISHALHYHKYGCSFVGEVQIITDALLDMSGSVSTGFNDRVHSCVKKVAFLLKDVSSEGDNPDVFTYKILKIRETNQVILQLNFYDGFKIVSIMKYA